MNADKLTAQLLELLDEKYARQIAFDIKSGMLRWVGDAHHDGYALVTTTGRVAVAVEVWDDFEVADWYVELRINR
jgi:hypothetical protein